MRLLVCGDRNWRNIDLIMDKLVELSPKVVIEGEARGADTQARQAAEELGIPVEKYPADWKKYGCAAGPIRNRQMLKVGKPDCVLAFHNDIEHSKGTKDMLRAAGEAGLSTILVSEK